MAPPLADVIAPRVPKAPPLVDGAERQVDSLPATLDLILKTAAPDPGHIETEARRLLRASLLPVSIQKIKVRDAGPFLQLARLPISEENPLGKRTIPNRKALELLADAGDVLNLLKDPLLRTLRHNPTDARRLRVVEASAERLKELARGVGGSFKASCNFFVERVVHLLDKARTQDVYASYKPLLNSIDDVVRDADLLLNLNVTIKLPSPAEMATAAMAAAADAAPYEAAEAEAEAGEGEGSEPEEAGLD